MVITVYDLKGWPWWHGQEIWPGGSVKVDLGVHRVLPWGSSV